LFAAVCPTYVVQQGDSPYSIAQKFDILQDDLKSAMIACGQDNELLQIGQEICLPGADKPGCANVQTFNNDDNCKVYIVQQGDTIESVALALNIYRDTLNSLNTDVMGPGGILQPQKFLKLPPWSNTCGDPNKSGEACRVYVVTQGDFIAGIAAAYGITVDELLSVNPGLDANSVLQNGQPIKIPPFPASCGAGTPSKPPTNTVLKCRGYRIQQGDSINDVAKAFKTTYNDVLAVNPELAGGALVQPGTIVKIPPYDNTCEKPILVGFPDESSPTPGTGVVVNPVPVPVTPIPVPVTPTPVPVTPTPVVIPPPTVTSPPPPSPPPAPIPSPTPSPANPPEPVVVSVAPDVSTPPAQAPTGSSSSLSTIVAAATGFLTFLLA
jgi:LysM repeat protein